MASLCSIAACGGGDGGRSGGNVPLEQVPARLAEAACSILRNCLSPPVADFFLQGRDCEAFLGRQFSNQDYSRLDEAIAAGTVVYDGTKVEGCLDALEALGCNIEGDLLPAACEEAFRGTVPVGMPCSMDFECVGDAVCVMRDSCPGTCTARVAAGGDCSSGLPCAVGLVCQDDGRCGAPAGPGEPCGGMSGRECRFGLACAGQEGDMPGRCEALSARLTATEGMSCNFDEGPLCRAGLSCALMGFGGMAPTMQCVRPVAAGGACYVAVPEMCPEGQYCNVNLMGGSFMGTCMPLPGDGQPCGMGVTGERCADGFACDEGDVCRRLQDNGGACTEDSLCYSDRCVSGRCEGPEFCTGR
ncbi:MAG: hypothetical protein RMK74_05670 [Myxococcales bacterium]|nr:hypothetical protein [Myxococcales bacterium]